jgi:hypothetical protein
MHQVSHSKLHHYHFGLRSSDRPSTEVFGSRRAFCCGLSTAPTRSVRWSPVGEVWSISSHVVIRNTNSLGTLGAVQIDPRRRHSAVNRQQPSGFGLVIFYAFAYRRMCTTEHFLTAIQARKKVPNSAINRLHNYPMWQCLRTSGSASCTNSSFCFLSHCQSVWEIWIPLPYHYQPVQRRQHLRGPSLNHIILTRPQAAPAQPYCG